MAPTARVTVPATTANIGPGFDCLGAALTLYNHFTFTLAETFAIAVTGSEADRLSRGPDNLVYTSFAALYQHVGQPVPSVHIAIDLNVPLSRGLGSSSTAIVGGLVAANLLAGSPLDTEELAALATELEGHPDNVVPALLGG
ncbi:MAG: homoserine kinase, partial [Moorea sp. SIO3C2]|nr:homoserine kinase [Moorena sp. SIO3C2]